MLSSRSTLSALAVCLRPGRVARGTPVALLVVSVCAPVALAGTPAQVTVRALGPPPSYEALVPLTEVSTNETPLVNDGNPKHSCSGTSAAGALQLATGGNWTGVWFEGEASGYFVEKVKGLGPGPASFWSFWLDNSEATKGICQAELEPGQQLLFFPECFSECSTTPEQLHVLGIEAPLSAEVGTQITVAVDRHSINGTRSPAAGVNVEGGGASAQTNAQGQALLTLSAAGSYTLRAAGTSGEEPKSVPGEAFVCVHAGSDGTCGTTAPPTPSTTQASASAGIVQASPHGGTTHAGPSALVAEITGLLDGHRYSRKHAPRVLSGKVIASASVTSISLRLRRTHRDRCWAYSGIRERFLRVRCGRGSFFQVASGGDSFSYLLPSRLAAGRYVLDVEATDATGKHTTLARGTSRIVFYVV